MKKLLNTLYITTEGTSLKKEGNTVVVTKDGQKVAQVPLIQLSDIICMGNIYVSPALMHDCSVQGISISFLTTSGKFLSRVSGPTTGNVLLRKKQYEVYDKPELHQNIVRNIITGKLFNMVQVLKRAIRDHGSKMDIRRVEESVSKIEDLLRKTRIEKDVDNLRGIEGIGSREYFHVFNEVITRKKEIFRFDGRSRRPPKDYVNALLSFNYTLLYHDVRSALETVGLDPSVGFLHRIRPGRFSLALDLMEEFRPVIADRLAVTLINLNQVSEQDFQQLPNKSVYLTDNGKKKVIRAYQERKKEEITHPFLREKIPVGMVFFAQSMLLARYLREDLEEYPPFFWK